MYGLSDRAKRARVALAALRVALVAPLMDREDPLDQWYVFILN